MSKRVQVKGTKTKYEAAIIEEHGFDGLTASRYDEHLDGKVAKLTLYYKNDRHIGTWQRGGGWYSTKKAHEEYLNSEAGKAETKLFEEV
jgi:hypothetical protein